MSELTRLSVNLNRETAEALKDIADREGISLTEAIRRAIALLKFITDEQAQGRKVQTMDANDRDKRELILM